MLAPSISRSGSGPHPFHQRATVSLEGPAEFEIKLRRMKAYCHRGKLVARSTRKAPENFSVGSPVLTVSSCRRHLSASN